MSGNYEEERAERAFSDYFGVDKCVSWKSQYGERPYSTYWSSSEQEREAVKEDLGIAAEHREALAEAEKSFEKVRSLVADSGLSVQEAKTLVNNVLRNVFREEPVKTTDLREELFWKETQNDRADSYPVEHENLENEEPDKFVFDELENNKVDIPDRLQHLVVPITFEVKASDLRPEAVREKFSEWRAVVHEILDERDWSDRRKTEEIKRYEEQSIDISAPQSGDQILSNGVLQSYDLEKQTSDVVAELNLESTGVVRVDDDIERIIFGDERADSLMQQHLKEEPQLDDRWARILEPKEERNSDERSR